MELRGDTQVARVRAVIRPMSAGLDMDPQRAYDLFDVILTAGSASSSDTPFLFVRRSPRDFAQLQRELERELGSSGDGGSNSSRMLATPLVITPAIDAYLATQGDAEWTEAAVAAEQFNSNTAVEFEARFAWQLEHFLGALANHADARVRNSLALKKFIRGGSELLSLEDREAVDKWLVDSGDQSSAAAAVNDRIPSGGFAEHNVQVQVGDGEGSPPQQHAQALVLWRFASQGRNVLFSAHFTERAEDDKAKGAADDGYDPYAASDPYSELGEEEAKDAYGSEEEDAGDAIVAHYSTYYSFPEAAEDQDFSSPQYECGYFLATASGELELEWENADETSILSKPLTFQVRVLPLPEVDAASEEIKKLVHKVSGTQQSHSDSGYEEDEEGAFWLQKLIKASKITSLNAFFGRSEDYIDDAVSAGLSFNAPHDSGPGGDGDEMLKRAQEEKDFHEQRARYFEERTAQLENALRESMSNLKKAQESITISEEIYKASLEAITQLEVAASASQQKAPASQNAPSSLLSSQAASTSPVQDAEENAVKGKGEAVVSDKELQRVVDLCTTFQEQCLWRSIELGESEKRNLVLDAKLQDSEQEKTELQARTCSLEEMVTALQAEVKKLKTHKSILVQEVKKLQPYSHVNLTALVQEAQEARMMQRSLQAQLDSRDAGESAASAPAAKAITAGEDGAGGGFVVVESVEHSSFFHGTAARQ